MAKEDFNIREAGINTFLKIVEEYNQKYDEQVKNTWIEIVKQAKENVEKERLINTNKDLYICTDCKSTFISDFYRCPECCKGYITLNK